MPLDFAHPLQLAVALPVTVLSLGMLGLLLASTFVLARNANAFSNLLEYPVWLATGLLVPLTLLPSPGSSRSRGCWLPRGASGRSVRPRSAATPGRDRDVRALGIVYLALGTVALANFERLARQRATLALT